MAKLTLSVDDRVVSNAKTYAKRRGTSVSKLVEGYLATIAAPADGPRKDAPVLRSLRGRLKSGGIEDYKKHLVSKYL